MISIDEIATYYILHLSDAGNHLYKVGTETPKSRATSFGGTPSAKRRFADFNFDSVFALLRPPILPLFLAASSPALVRFNNSSL